jgi:uncharacterized membrane-anchored protein YhcB (DUF1043 family)
VKEPHRSHLRSLLSAARRKRVPHLGRSRDPGHSQVIDSTEGMTTLACISIRTHPSFANFQDITMQDNFMQTQTQPFTRLAEANMELVTRFSTSPEVMSQASSITSQIFQLTTESAMKLMQSGAFASMLQGMQKNYTDFLAGLSQSGMAMISEGQANMSKQMQEAADSVIDAAGVRGRRARQAA